MPATFPAHPAAVLPLKLWRPAWFDGVALVVGSMAPDLAYALDGSWLERPFPGLPPLWQLAHSLPWFLAWAMPVTLALCPLIRLCAPTIAAHLPALVSHLLRFASVGRGPRWWVTACSAAIGALSHVLWDRIAVGPLDLASSLLGGLFCLWLLHRLGRRSSTIPPSESPTDAKIARSRAPGLPASAGAGHNDAAEPTGPVQVSGVRRRRHPGFFWGTVAAVVASGGVVLPLLPGYFLAHTTSARVILLGIAAVVIATAATETRSGPFGRRRESVQQ